MNETNWELRYQMQDTPWEKGAASPGLVDFLKEHPDIQPASVCIPGCGTGHDVGAWAAAGFSATGIDLAPSAIRLSQEKTLTTGLSPNFVCADFLHDKPPQLFDWLFEHTLFCAINPDQRDNYVRAITRWLKPGGYFLAVHYLIPESDGPPFGTTREEISERFTPYFELLGEWVPRSYPNRTGLERMFWWQRKPINKQ